jgi:hypothetical protein
MEFDNQEAIDRLSSLIEKNEISSKALAAQIVVFRSLGFGKKISIMCMEELAKRRMAGEVFDFENFIEEEVKKVPQLDPDQFKTLTSNFTIQSLAKFLKTK